MKAIRADLSENFKEVEVLVIADYHFGDPHCNIGAIKRDIDYLKEHENAFCVFAGDLMNCALRNSLGDVYTDMSPMEQLSWCSDMLSPIAHKCLAVVTGNHENRHYKTNGVDMTRILARQLGVEEKYSTDTALVFLRFGEDLERHGHHRPILYTIYLTHGSGGGRKEGGKIQRLVDYASIVDADIYLAGHTHLPASLKVGYARPCPANSSITYCSKLFVNSAAALDYGGYGDTGGYKVPSLDSPRIVLSGERKDMRVVL